MVRLFRARVSGLVAAMIAGLVIAGVALLYPGAALAATISATFSQESTWPGGYNGRYAIAATTTVTGWTVEFDLPSTTTVATAWEATMTRSGNHYRFVNLA